jgi:peptidoglycan/LPS O-acetylase OafA/YrhL
MSPDTPASDPVNLRPFSPQLSNVAHLGESPNLDLMRSFAVLSVFVDHIAGTFGIAQRHGDWFWALAHWGVLLFFVHTSFVLMMSMERLRLDGLKLHTTFYIRRLFRIYQLSIVAVVVVVMTRIPVASWDAYTHLSHRTIFSNLILCQNLFNRPSVMGPLWSLPLEVQMYLLLPALFIFVRRTSIGPLVGVWLASVGIGLVQPWLGAASFGQQLGIDRLGIAEYIPCFLAGVIAYYISLRRNGRSLPFWAWALTLFVMAAVYSGWWVRAGNRPYQKWICCLVIGLVVVQCAESTHQFLNRLTHHIAKYSYGLYLGQVPVLWLVFIKLNGLRPSLQWPLFIFLIIAVPVASYHLIEHPLIRIGARMSSSEINMRALRPAP